MKIWRMGALGKKNVRCKGPQEREKQGIFKEWKETRKA